MSEVHISSVMLYVAREDLAAIANKIKSLPGADLVRVDANEGCLTTVFETESLKQLRLIMSSLERLDGVAQVSLLFHNIVQPSAAQQISA